MSPGTVACGTGHIFGGGNNAENIERQFQLSNGLEDGENGDAAAFVEFHFVHLVGRLDRDAAGIERDGFPDERNGRGVFGAVIFEDDQVRFIRAAATDGQQSAETARLEFLFGEDGAHQTRIVRQFAGIVRHDAGGDDVAGQIANFAGVIGGLGGDLCVRNNFPGCLQVGVCGNAKRKRL